MVLFKEEERTALYNQLVQIGQLDNRIIGGALVGSFAADKQDKWSDLDISFGIKGDINPKKVLDKWADLLSMDYEIIHYFDVPHSLAIYRVLLFSSGLEVDLSVIPESEYGPKSPNFRLLFGRALENKKFPNPSIEKLRGWGWHHVMHANSSINRGKLWQAEFWISNLREHIIALKCLRFGLPSAHGRGVDQLPKSELNYLDKTLIKAIEVKELRTSLNSSTQLLVEEIAKSNKTLAGKLTKIFKKALGNDYQNG
ncbi:MAG: hypothetical protein CL840_11515 [Crocinitomicaceae bacterium]|nr:hypothetical protein [Crocinitomicaceae bacterium]|tara:strand:+ start:2550 stop:3314 length:765 start_codon:yes stop_codon:yes gene_type:complete